MLNSKSEDKEDHNATGEGELGQKKEAETEAREDPKINTGLHKVDLRGEAVHGSVLSHVLHRVSTAPGNAGEKFVGI